MLKGTIIRKETSDQGTFGELSIPGTNFKCVSLELPWRDNKTGLSCIPAGEYLFKWIQSPKHGWCYEGYDDPSTPQKEDILRRDKIQIHSANLAGDISKGYISQLLGCIALGECVVQFQPGKPPAGAKAQRGISASRSTMQDFEKSTEGNELLSLLISWDKSKEPDVS